VSFEKIKKVDCSFHHRLSKKIHMKDKKRLTEYWSVFERGKEKIE